MFWRKKLAESDPLNINKNISDLQTEVYAIRKRVEQLECEHELFDFNNTDVRWITESLFVVGPYKKCKKCGKEISLPNKCEWLKQKHEQEKAIADATAKKLKECKP